MRWLWKCSHTNSHTQLNGTSKKMHYFDKMLTLARIDTQDVLLGEQNTERIIEIGPSDTLTVMAKRTISTHYQERDSALSIKRQLLSGESNTAEIYYELEPKPVGRSRDDETAPFPYTPAAPEPSQLVRASPVTTALTSHKKPDVPVTALEIIVGIIAQKLKKTTADISTSCSIKSLVSGMPFLPTTPTYYGY